MSISKWTDKQIVLHSYNGIQLSIENEITTHPSNNERIFKTYVKQKKPNIKEYTLYNYVYC